MGNTIRRQPISFKIPDSPDYKYLNLTSFAGLHQTDNPFTAQANSASDVLNVYVDENNALTTRPRVVNKIDFSKIEGVIVASYVLNNKTYFKIKNGDVVSLYDDSGTLFDLANDVILNETEFSMLDYNGTLILFDGTQILVYENAIWVMAKNWSKLPIPLTTIRHTENLPEGVLLDTMNVLTNKHRESYNLSSSNTDFISNDYYGRKGTLYENAAVKQIYNTKKGFVVLFDDGCFIHSADNSNEFVVGEMTERSVTTTTVSGKARLDYRTTQAKQKRRVAWSTQTGFVVLWESSKTKEWLFTEITIDGASETDDIYFSPSGNYLIRNSWFGQESHIFSVYSCEENTTSNSLSVSKIGSSLKSEITNTSKVYIDYSDNIYVVGDDGEPENLYKIILTENNAELKLLGNIPAVNNRFINAYSSSTSGGGIIADGTKIYSWDCSGYIDLTGKDYTEIKIVNDSKLYNNQVFVSEDGTIFYGALATKDINDNNLYFRKSIVSGITENSFIPYTKNIDARKLYLDIKTTLNNAYMACRLSDDTFVIFHQNFTSSESLYELLYDQNGVTPEININNILLFDNTFWFYSTNSNIVRWNSGDNPLYIPDTNYDEVGDEKPLTNALIISENTLGLFKKDKTYTATPATINEQYTYLFTELTNEYGCYSPHGAVVSPLRNIPIVVGLNEISGLYSSENISKVNRYYSSLSLNVDRQYRKTDYKNNRHFVPEKIWAANIKYWSVFACSCDFGSRWLIFDDRTSDWFYWEVPAKVDNLWSDNDKLYFLSNKDKKIRAFETSDIIHPQNPELTEYYDLNRKLIKWHWTSQILPLGTINYYKKLIDTTFIVADTEANDSYGLNYTFRAYRKNISESDLNTIKNELQYVQSVTKKTLISRFNFLQFEISHTEDDDQLNNNKLRLIGMALKYVLLGGIMQ